MSFLNARLLDHDNDNDIQWYMLAKPERQDVLTRRSKEFDRAAHTTDVVMPILREHHFSFPSGPKQRAHRALLSDLMTPAFLNEVSAKPFYLVEPVNKVSQLDQ